MLRRCGQCSLLELLVECQGTKKILHLPNAGRQAASVCRPRQTLHDQSSPLDETEPTKGQERSASATSANAHVIVQWYTYMCGWDTSWFLVKVLAGIAVFRPSKYCLWFLVKPTWCVLEPLPTIN